MNTLYGRSSSHFTRVTRMFADELGVPVELVPIFDVTRTEPAIYGGNPALKMPTLICDGVSTFGTENICRKLAAIAPTKKHIVWPEAMDNGELVRNAQELVWHSMTAQVQLIFGTGFSKLPSDNVYFVKAAAGLTGALQWLDENVEDVLRALPTPRDLSLFEVTLFCLVEHLTFRPTVPVDTFVRLRAFGESFAAKPSAERTRYAIDPKPTGSGALAAGTSLPTQFFHGTRADLGVGDLIQVGYRSNYAERSLSWVYLTGTLDAAIWGAELARGDGRQRIYIVEPTGPIVDDPNLTNKRFPGNPTKSYRSREPLRVVGEVATWDAHTPEQLQRMKDSLERLRAEGRDVIED